MTGLLLHAMVSDAEMNIDSAVSRPGHASARTTSPSRSRRMMMATDMPASARRFDGSMRTGARPMLPRVASPRLPSWDKAVTVCSRGVFARQAEECVAELARAGRREQRCDRAFGHDAPARHHADPRAEHLDLA